MVLGILLAALVVPAAAQISSRTAMNWAAAARRAAHPGQGRQQPRAALPGRFLGWKDAARRGANVVRYFKRVEHPRATTRPRVLAATPQRRAALAAGGAGPALQAVGTPALPGLDFRPTLPAGGLTSAVATGDFNSDGWQDFVAADPAENRLWLYLGRGNGTFSDPILMPLGGLTPLALAAANLTGQGSADDIVVGDADSGTVEVLLARGDGSFAAPVVYQLDGPVIALQLADVNLDQHLDVVTLVQGVGVEVLLGAGDGSFAATPAVTSNQMTAGASAMVVAPFRRGQPPDIALVSGVYVYLDPGNGDGSFSGSATKVSEGFELTVPNAITAGDIDGDGCQDLIFSSAFGLAQAFRGNCDGTFQAEMLVPLGDNDYGLMLADVNGDGWPDLIGSGVYQDAGFLTGGDSVGVALNDGSGHFKNTRLYRGEPYMYSLAAADFNGDGALDLVAVSQSAGVAIPYLNDGQGQFGSPQGESVGFDTGPTNTPRSFPMRADINGNGQPDLVFAGNALKGAEPVFALLNRGDGTFSDPVVSSDMSSGTGGPLYDCLAGAFHTGRSPDVLCATNHAFTLAAGQGDGTFATATMTATNGVTPGYLVAGDFNGDGQLDFAAVGLPANSTITLELPVFLGHGDGTFTEVDNTIRLPATLSSSGTGVTLVSLTGVQGLFAGDFNHDGRLDLVVDSDFGSFELPGQGDGTVGTPVGLAVPPLDVFQVFRAGTQGPWVLTATPGPEAIATPPVPPQVSIFLDQADGTFALNQTFSFDRGTEVVPWQGDMIAQMMVLPLLADMNGDGIPDLVIGETNGELWSSSALGLQFLIGQGDGSFVATHKWFPLYKRRMPEMAMGLGKAGGGALVEFNDFVSSFTVVPATAAPPFTVALVDNPVTGSGGRGRITLDLTAASDTTLNLSSNDPDVIVPNTVVVPAGQATADFDFQVTANPDRTRTFTITASGAGSTASATGSFANLAQPALLRVYSNTSAAGNFRVFQGTTGETDIEVESAGLYQSEATLSCSGLPAGLTCGFLPAKLPVTAAASGSGEIVVSVPATMAPGNYSFTVTAQADGISVTTPITLTVLASSPDNLAASLTPLDGTSISAGGALQFLLTVGAINNYNYTGPITAGCSGLPADLACSFSPASFTAVSNAHPGSTLLTVTRSAAAGSGPLPGRQGPAPLAWLMAGLLLGLGLAWAGRRGRRARTAVLAGGLGLWLVAMCACGGGGGPGTGPSSTPTPTPLATSAQFNVTVTGAAFGTQKLLTVTLAEP